VEGQSNAVRADQADSNVRGIVFSQTERKACWKVFLIMCGLDTSRSLVFLTEIMIRDTYDEPNIIFSTIWRTLLIENVNAIEEAF
jgi:hypothetical protein